MNIKLKNILKEELWYVRKFNKSLIDQKKIKYNPCLSKVLVAIFYDDPNEVDFLVSTRFDDNTIKVIMKDTMVSDSKVINIF